MIQGAENIAGLFSILHDGRMENIRRGDDVVVMDVEIGYLTQRVNPSYTKFVVHLIAAENFSFETWEKEPAGSSQTLIGIDAIFQHHLQILSGEVLGDEVMVVCNAPGASQSFCGGKLRFRVAKIRVEDEGSDPWSIEQLTRLASDYWSEWSHKDRSDS